jgi:hypothetical protein
MLVVTTSPGQLRRLLQSQSTNSDTDSLRYAVHVYSCNLSWSTEVFFQVIEYKLRYRQSKVGSTCVQLQPYLVNWGLCFGHGIQTQIQTIQYMQYISTTETSAGQLRLLAGKLPYKLTWSTEAFALITEYKLRYRQYKICSTCSQLQPNPVNWDLQLANFAEQA